MPKTKPEPWYCSRRQRWYLELEGKQYRLIQEKVTKTKSPPQEVMAEYYRIMASEGRVDDRAKQRATLTEVIEAFLRAKRHTREGNVRCYRHMFKPILAKHGHRQFAAIRRDEIVDAIADHEPWAPSTKHEVFNRCKTLFRWAREYGYLERNEWAGVDSPWPRGQRERGWSLDEYRSILEFPRDHEFKLVIRLFYECGFRNGELCGLEASNLHPDLDAVVLRPEQHKTGRRTGRVKTVPVPPDLMATLRALAERYPVGPIVRNKLGKPFSIQYICNRFRIIRESLGLGNAIVPHGARHAHTTRLLEEGHDPARVASILGHRDVRTTTGTYYHPELARLIEIVAESSARLNGHGKATDDKEDLIRKITAEVIRQLQQGGG